ncbi:MAG: tetratricopeptide repeat protein [Treponema sp.]|nr:tetratricopeptide repeat protein [Treponema sp.]
MSDNILQAYSLLRSGKPSEAKVLLNNALVYELENQEILFAINCCNFWIDVMERAKAANDNFERGQTYCNEWKNFLQFLNREEQTFDRTLFAAKTGVFSSALACFNQLADERDPILKAEILRKLGLCYKKLGSYETARNYLGEANEARPDSSPIIAEMADCYALCGEEKQAKVLFREAFYIDPQKIEQEFLDSELIQCLIRNVRQKGYSGAALMEWLPVYGQLYGVFTVKRRLRPQEIARLKQEIYAKETEIKDPSCQRDLLTPRLINLYFWLIDYYVAANENVSKMNDIITRIKILDTEIYELYIK